MKYFAYGSNMSSKRLGQRVPSAAVIGTYRLVEFKLCFHKKSKDGSAKCDVVHTGKAEDFVLGVLFDIHENEKVNLDKAEGLGYGYEIKEVNVANENETVAAFLYYATDIDDSLKPYNWYKEHVVKGAVEAGLPDDYLSRIKSVISKPDQNTDRALKQRFIHL